VRRPLLLASSAVLSAIVLACVGDDPPATTGDADAGSTEGGPADASSSDTGATGDGAPSDAGADASDASCNPTAPFGAPVAVTELDTGFGETSISLSSDELTAYFIRDGSLYVAARAARTAPFGAAGLLTSVNQAGTMQQVAITHDGQVLYTVSTIESGPKVFASVSGVGGFGAPAKVSGPSGDFYGSNPYLNTQKSFVYYDFPTVGDGGGPHDAIHMASIAAPTAWASPVLVNELFSGKGDRAAVLSADQKTLYFASKRGGLGDDVYVTTRATVGAQWGTPQPVTEVNTTSDDAPAWLSDDGCRLYIVGFASGNDDIYIATRGF
jgi:hypothetical protein